MDETEARRAVGQARVARLATTSTTGRVDLVPITFALLTGAEGDRVASIVDHKPKTTTRLKRLENIRAEPEVALLIDHYDEDWAQLWWVRLRGRARVVEDGPVHAEVVRALQARYRQYEEHPPTGAAVVVDVHGWQWWSGAGS